MSADATFWEQVALHGDLSRWTIDDVARAELAAWEEAKGFQLPEEFRDARWVMVAASLFNCRRGSKTEGRHDFRRTR